MTKAKINSRNACDTVWYYLIFSLLYLPVANFAQTHQQSPSSQDRTESEIIHTQSYNLVLVEVEVKSEFGEYVSNLRHENFVVKENGKRKDIVYCSTKSLPGKSGDRIAYDVGYYPGSKTEDEEFRKIRVRVRKGKKLGLKIRYWPEGYFIPQSK